MSKYFKVAGFFNDDKSEFDDFIIKEFNDSEEDPLLDDAIFYYGLSETQIIGMIANPDENEEFTLTSYQTIKFP